MLGVTSGSALWYLSRSTGIVTLLLLTASVVMGVLTTVRWERPNWPRFITVTLHRNVSLLVVVFLGIHIVSTIADGFAPISWLDAFVPFTSSYRPIWLGLGALAFDLLLALTITSLLRQRIGLRVWRAVHWSAYACWPIAVVHGLGTGTDVRSGWALALVAVCLGAVLGSVWWRLAATPSQTAGSRGMAAAASVVLPLLIISWLWVGPLQQGWARRAGTPPSVLAKVAAKSAAANGTTTTTPASGAPATTAPSASTSGADPFAGSFTANLRGTVSQSQSDGGQEVTVTLDGRVDTSPAGQLQITLRGPAAPGGGIEMRVGRASLGTTSNPTMYRGSVESLNGSRITLALQDTAGHSINVLADLTLNDAGTRFTGTLSNG